MDSNELLFESIFLVIFFKDRSKIVEIAGAPFLLKNDRLIYASDEVLVVILAHQLVQTSKEFKSIYFDKKMF